MKIFSIVIFTTICLSHLNTYTSETRSLVQRLNEIREDLKKAVAQQLDQELKDTRTTRIALDQELKATRTTRVAMDQELELARQELKVALQKLKVARQKLKVAHKECARLGISSLTLTELTEEEEEELGG